MNQSNPGLYRNSSLSFRNELECQVFVEGSTDATFLKRLLNISQHITIEVCKGKDNVIEKIKLAKMLDYPNTGIRPKVYIGIIDRDFDDEANKKTESEFGEHVVFYDESDLETMIASTPFFAKFIKGMELCSFKTRIEKDAFLLSQLNESLREKDPRLHAKNGLKKKICLKCLKTFNTRDYKGQIVDFDAIKDSYYSRQNSKENFAYWHKELEYLKNFQAVFGKTNGHILFRLIYCVNERFVSTGLDPEAGTRQLEERLCKMVPISDIKNLNFFNQLTKWEKKHKAVIVKEEVSK